MYEHFGGKEGLYAVVIDREMQRLLDVFTGALTAGTPARAAGAGGAGAADVHRAGDRRVPDPGPGLAGGQHQRHVLQPAQRHRQPGRVPAGRRVQAAAASTPKLAGLYSQALVGMVALTGQWWLEVRKPKRDEVAAHLVNLAWYGLSELKPRTTTGHARAIVSAVTGSPTRP